MPRGNTKSRLVTTVIFVFVLAGNLFAGAWTLKRGQLWTKTSVLFQETSERYYSRNTPCPLGHNCTRSGERVPFPFNGQSQFTAIALDLAYGVTDNFELKFQLPFFDIKFTDDTNPLRPTTSELGDVRFGARYSILIEPLVTTLKVEAKDPTGFFNVDSEVVPIGDGQ